jgi:leucine-rich repeat protein SHOC2
VTEEELEAIIEKARIDRVSELNLRYKQLSRLPDSIGSIRTLKRLDLTGNELTKLPDSIGKLAKLDTLDVTDNWLTTIPESIGNLTHLIRLSFEDNHLTYLPESISNLTNLVYLYLGTNSLTYLPESIGKLNNLKWLLLACNSIIHLPVSFGNFCNLVDLDLQHNDLSRLPESIINLSKLTSISLDVNLIVNLSILQLLPKLQEVSFLSLALPRRYWINLSEWNPKWLLDEENAEIRRVLIQQIGYERICQELDTIETSKWREYTLITIDNIEKFYDRETWEEVTELMVFLKMTCPSTGHIHILRVPPEMTSAETAITWVNHGIHPDEFIVQT